MAESVLARLGEASDDSYTTFKSVSRWKEDTGGKVAGYFPVYFPEELAHSMGLLSVSLQGASGGVSLDMATAHTQSFVCSISRSVFQMALQGNLEVFDALIFSNICDVARNLSGITKRNVTKYIDYIHYPVNNSSSYAAAYLKDEYLRIAEGLGRVSGSKFDPDKLRASTTLHNEKRRLLKRLVELRRERPELIPYTEWYSVIRAGAIMPAAAYVAALGSYLDEVSSREARPMDKIRVAVVGNFCEQIPVMLMKVIEDAGCYVVNDEALIGGRWLGEVRTDGEDPLLSLAEAYIQNREPLTVRFHPEINKQEYITGFLKEIRADGVIFLTPKFCEPALYDYMIYKAPLEQGKTPYLHLEYEESSSSFEHVRNMVETFAESILFD